MSLETTLANYGLAGITIGLFYCIIRKELQDLKSSVDTLASELHKLVIVLGQRKTT